MKDKLYCIVVLDNTQNIEEDLSFIATDPINIINGGKKNTVSVATFKSALSPARIKKALNVGNRRTFFVFELDAKTCSTHIDDESLHDFLFRDLDVDSESIIEDETRAFLEEYDSAKLPHKYDEEALRNLNEEERELLIDKLLNNVKTLTNNQKKTLSFLASL